MGFGFPWVSNLSILDVEIRNFRIPGIEKF